MSDVVSAFESPRLLIAGGKRHIAALEASLVELRKCDWMVPEADTQGNILLAPKVKVPPEMKQIAYDVTSNLRSALDHAVYASTHILTGHEGSGTKFPFGDTKDEAEGDAKRRCPKVPADIVNLCLAFEPYRAGNRLMWALNKLRNGKNHRILVPVAAYANLAGQGHATPGASASYEWDQATGHFKPKLELAEGTPAGGVMYNFRLDILIGTGELRGEPAIGIFNSMASEVERIVSAIEAETIRLL